MFRWLRSLSGGRGAHRTGLMSGGPGAYRAPARRAVGRRWRTDQELLAILLSIPELHEQRKRHKLLELMGDRLDQEGPFAVPDDPDARTHLRAVLRAARRTGTLDALRDALLELQPDDIGVAWFTLAATALTPPAGPLPTDLVLDLVCELRTHHPAEFGRTAVARYLTERRTAGRPLDARSLPQVLSRLYDARTSAAHPDAPRADLLRFLRLLDAEPGRSDRLASLLAPVLHGHDHEDRSPDTPQAGAAVPLMGGERQIIIQIRVEEEDAPSDLPPTRRRYSLRGYHYERVGDAKPVFLGCRDLPELFTGEELAADGCGFLASWQEPAVAGRDVSKRVEFLLPHSLLGWPIDSWPGGPAGVPVGQSCQVVVRSLTRYRDSWTHGEWFRRWKALDRDCAPGDALERIGWMSRDEPGEGACGETSPETAWSCPSGTYPPLRLKDAADVGDWLGAHDDLSCLGLDAPYDDQLVRKAVEYALLWDGIPVMVWRRDGGDPGPLLDALRAGGPPALLAELPHSVYRARRNGRRDASGVHHQITLLWDDPTCVFSGQDQQMSGTRGAGGGAA